MEEYDRPAFFLVMKYAEGVDRDVIDMVSGNPDWEPPAALREGIREYADADVSAYQYPPSTGLRELREAIADRHGVDVDSVVVTNGTGEANHLATACGYEVFDGEEILLTDPVYPYYYGRASMLGATARFVAAAEDGQLDPAAVREAASSETSVIVVNSPNNPTGAVYGAETKRELVAIAEEYDALLVSDEVYEQFDYGGSFASALSVDSPNRAVTNGFSKSMAVTGLRMGYGIYPESVIDEVRTQHMLINVACSRPAQHAVLKALRETPEAYYEATRAVLGERIETFCSALDDIGATYTRPQGGFYIMVRFDGFPGTLDNVKRLIEEAGVAGMPGDAFGDSREEWIRFALVTPRVEEAADRLAAFFD
ncbi:MAG: pyridoxal phosphate-dependent aminotransferase [Natronomonas sp.]